MNNSGNTNFSIIVPTYREVSNIPALAKRIADVDVAGRLFEVILVDDNSEDGSAELVAQLSSQYPWLTMIVRKKPRDLSQSIIEGLQNAQYPILITMDADLSHPPEKIPEMLALLTDPNVDVVIGSRYVTGGSIDEKWSLSRKIASWSAALLARILLATRAKDPLSGFMAIRQQTFRAGDTLKPIGWKIGLEIMIKCRCKTIREIPIHFSQRCYGTSKLNAKIAFEYFLHVLQLVRYKWHTLSRSS